MRIKEIINRSRRDFTAVYVCEHCGHEQGGSGYDDAYFHKEVIPNMECSECGKTADGKVTSYAVVPEGVVM